MLSTSSSALVESAFEYRVSILKADGYVLFKGLETWAEYETMALSAPLLAKKLC